MKIHQMKLARAPYLQIESGEKTIESRLFDVKRRQINPRDQILFTCADDDSKTVLTTVRALYRYSNFEQLFMDFSPSLLGGNSVDDLMRQIEKYYTRSEEDKYGVVGILIERVEDSYQKS